MTSADLGALQQLQPRLTAGERQRILHIITLRLVNQDSRIHLSISARMTCPKINGLKVA